MNREEYDLIPDSTGTRFDFFSKGPKGVIWKAIRFQNFGGQFFNLSFGNWDEALGKIDDMARINNQDQDKVFNTVASAVLKFLDKFPGAGVIARGRTPARTRLFQMSIKAHWFEINMLLKIYGNVNGKWKRMKRNKNYEAFLVSKTDIFHLINKSTWTKQLY